MDGFQGHTRNSSGQAVLYNPVSQCLNNTWSGRYLKEILSSCSINYKQLSNTVGLVWLKGDTSNNCRPSFHTTISYVSKRLQIVHNEMVNPTYRCHDGLRHSSELSTRNWVESACFL